MSDTPPAEGITSEPPAITTAASLAALCRFNPNAGFGQGARVFDGAGVGDLGALQTLTSVSIEEALSRPDDDPYALVCAAEALALARISASRRVPSDVRTLAGALCLTADRARRIGAVEASETMLGECIAILERLAEEGDTLAALSSDRIAETSFAATKIAKDLLSKPREVA